MQVCVGDWTVRGKNYEWKRMEVEDTFRKRKLDRLVKEVVGATGME